jgi:hypothetical protein
LIEVHPAPLPRTETKGACGLGKPHKQGWDEKKTFADLRRAVAHEQQIRDGENTCGLNPEERAACSKATTESGRR